MTHTKKWTGIVAALAAAGVLVAGCGDDDDSSESASSGSSQTASDAAAALGPEKKATGEPLVVGMLNLESGPVTFPEYRQAAEAAIEYINNHKGGVGGRPVQLEACATDGQPSTSGRCAGQIADKKPAFILGGADIGAPGAFEVWKRADLAVVGGIPFTPVESNAPNALEFMSVSVADNAAASKFAVEELGVKKASVIYTDDTQGKFTGLGVIAQVLEAQGVEVNTVPLAPNAADFSSVAASAIESQPDMVYVNSPNACAGVLKALKSVGSTAKIFGIDPCSSPQAIETAGDGAEGLYFAQPFDSLDSGTDDAKLMLAAIEKYGDKDIHLDSIAQAGFSAVMNMQAALDGVSDLNTKSILAAFKDGKEHPNFLAHPYVCDGKQVPGASAVCNGYQKMKQVKSAKVTTVDDQWITGTEYYKPPAQ